MKVEKINANNFMLFNEATIDFSKNINVISGENSVGKTALLKILYCALKVIKEVNSGKADKTKEQLEETMVAKLQGVFRPDDAAIGRLVGRKQGSNRTDVDISLFDSTDVLSFGFGNRQEKRMDVKFPNIQVDAETEIVYIPPKEIISSTENFTSLYDDYYIAFEETYYDLARLLGKPLKKGANTKEQNQIMDKLEKILDATIVQKDKKFFLKVKGSGEFEMGLLSEGYRKIATIMYLILSGSLGKNSVLFWDEPETNMNPMMIRPICETLVALAKMGVQVFITTHDYFVQQCFNLISAYPKANQNTLDIRFISLYRSEGIIRHESSHTIAELSHNSIMEEFDLLYEREQGMFYDN